MYHKTSDAEFCNGATEGTMMTKYSPHIFVIKPFKTFPKSFIGIILAGKNI